MSAEILLVLDVGNTGVTVGAFNGNALSGRWQLSTHRERTADEYGILLHGLLRTADLRPADVRGMAVACVVPPVVEPLTHMAASYFDLEPLFVGPGVRTGVPILTESPQDVGADRIVNAVAAFARYGGPTLVVDLGTATTVDAISTLGEYLGGVIAPGVGIAAEALFDRAARLPRVELKKPRQVIGRSTVASMQSGLVYGYAALVDGLVRRMAAELAPPAGVGVRVVATGGHAASIAGECETLTQVDPDLTLEGLRRVWERHTGGKARC